MVVIYAHTNLRMLNYVSVVIVVADDAITPTYKPMIQSTECLLNFLLLTLSVVGNSSSKIFIWVQGLHDLRRLKF